MTSAVTPQDAASLIIVDKSQSEPRILMGRRPAKSSFIPDAFVFPGGKVDVSDRNIRSDQKLIPDVEQSLLKANCQTSDHAHALAYAAIRETQEETGLLVGVAGKISAAEHHPWAPFIERNLAPAVHKLELIARAITPRESPKRFHARFFLTDAEYVEGEIEPSEELSSVDWYPISEAQKLPIIDVTEMVLNELVLRFRDTGPSNAKNPSKVAFISYRQGVPNIRYQ